MLHLPAVWELAGRPPAGNEKAVPQGTAWVTGLKTSYGQSLSSQ